MEVIKQAMMQWGEAIQLVMENRALSYSPVLHHWRVKKWAVKNAKSFLYDGDNFTVAFENFLGTHATEFQQHATDENGAAESQPDKPCTDEVFRCATQNVQDCLEASSDGSHAVEKLAPPCVPWCGCAGHGSPARYFQETFQDITKGECENQANPTQPRNIDEYIAGFPSDVQAILKKIRRTIEKAAPEAEEKIGYQMPTFTLNGNLVYFAAFKKHIGFYPVPTGIVKFKQELAVYKQGRGSVQFPFDKPIPYDLIRRIVKFRVKENVTRAAACGKKK